MKKNMSMVDRLIRMIIAVVLVLLNLTGVATGALAIVFWILAVIMGLTSVLGWCPLYALLKIKTLKAE